MRALIATLFLTLCSFVCAEGEQPAFTSHQEAAQSLIHLLSQTEACLAGCTDAPSVQNALPRLRELAAQAAQFKAAQNSLPEPTTQDYLAAQAILGEFNTVWNAIRAHIERLEKAQLLSPELRQVLRISAPEQKAPENS